MQTQDTSQLRESLLKFGQDETKLVVTPKSGDPVEGKVVSVTATAFKFRDTKSGDVKEISFDSVASISVVPNSHRKLIVGVLLGVAGAAVLWFSYLGCALLCG